MARDNPPEQAGGARPPRPTFTNPRKKTFTHDNTFAGSGVGVSSGGRRKQHFDFDECDHKYSINKDFPGTSNGPHIKGVHSYIFSDNKKDYDIHDNYGSFLHNKFPVRSSKNYDDLDDLDFGLGKAYSTQGLRSRSGSGSRYPSTYESPLYKSCTSAVSRTPLDISTSSYRRSSPVPSSPVPPRRSTLVGSSPSFARRSPSPVRRTQVPSSYSSYRRSPSPSPTPVPPSASLYRRSPSPASSSPTIYRSSTTGLASVYRSSTPTSSYRSSTPSASYSTAPRRASPSPVRRSFPYHVSASPAPPPQRRASFAHPSPSPQRRASFAHQSPTPQRRASFAVSITAEKRVSQLSCRNNTVEKIICGITVICCPTGSTTTTILFTSNSSLSSITSTEATQYRCNIIVHTSSEKGSTNCWNHQKQY